MYCLSSFEFGIDLAGYHITSDMKGDIQDQADYPDNRNYSYRV